MTEITRTITCFGGATTVAIDGDGPLGDPRAAFEVVRDLLFDWHAMFSRFKPESELCRLNADPNETVSISPMMARFIQAAVDAAEQTQGLVDATLLDNIEAAGYKQDRLRASMSLPLALALNQDRGPGGGNPQGRWAEVQVDAEAGKVTRPPGLHFDGGGLVKGLCADAAAEALEGYSSFVVDCDGDLRIGGTGGAERVIEVPNPFKGEVMHQFSVSDGGMSTSSIEKRSWMGEGMKPAHQVINPSTGRPAFTGVVQVTALAPTALQSDIRAKAALLSGPEGAVKWLPHGGFIVLDDSSCGEVRL